MPRFKQMPLPVSQIVLFSQTVDDALPATSDVRGFKDVMECLSYCDIESKCSSRGCPPYPPKQMVMILCYAYSKGIRSSRRIEELLHVDMRFIWLAGGLKPDHNTLARFRKDNWEELTHIFKDSVRVCCKAGLVLLNCVSTDGSKIAAAASKRRVYGGKRLERELEAVEKILREAEQADRSEDEQYGDGSGSELPEHLRDARERRARLKEIARQLKASDRKTVVVTEPDSRVMLTRDGKRPAYNLQASVDAENQIIVAMKLTQRENDRGFLPEMIEAIVSDIGVAPTVSLADTGYSDEETLKWLQETGHDALMPLQEQPQESKRNDLFASKCFLASDDRDALICPAGRELAYKGEYRKVKERGKGSGTYRWYAAMGCRSCSFRDECVGKGRTRRRIDVSIVADQRRQMKKKLNSEEGKQLYQKRQETSEPVFGRMKQNMGFRRFLLRGFTGAIAESALVCMAHNVSKCATRVSAMSQLALCTLVRNLQHTALSLIRLSENGPAGPPVAKFAYS